MARHKTLREELAEVDYQTLYSMILDAQDWPMVLVTATFLDRMLQFAIQSKFKNELTPAEEEDLFSGYGPLASFSAKITLAYAQGLISPDARHDLRIIKNIRNKAAHRMAHFSLEEESIKQSCLSLSLNAPLKLEGSLEENAKLMTLDPTTPRGRFVVAAHHIIDELTKDIQLVIGAVKTIATVVKALDTPQMREALKSLGIDLSQLASSPEKSP